MKENKLIDPYKFFVNDSFNWTNANLGLKNVSDYKHKERRIKELAWLPEGIEDPYLLNSKGYRSDEFLETRDMVFAGCSQTFGDGLLNNAIWGNILSEKMNLKSYNLGLGGISTQFIVQNLIGFFKEYGNPKFLFCLFPEFTRFQMKSKIEFMKSFYDEVNESGRKDYPVMQFLSTDKNPKYSKAPHIAENIIPEEFTFSISIDYIRMLEFYCKANNIVLRWGTWNNYQDEYINKNISKMDFENYVYLGMIKWEQDRSNGKRYFHADGNTCRDLDKECTSYDDCHEEIKVKFGKIFDMAMDLDIKNKKSGHLPAHVQTHIAEDFERSLNNDKN
jgi:hypothetical protein